jgi:exportin-1
MAEAGRSIEYLRQQETAKSIANILRANVRVASALGRSYISQLSKIFIDMLGVYKAYSECISNAVATGGAIATKTSVIRAMRSVKKETLKLFETFIQKTSDLSVICQNFLPPLFEAVLLDYKAGIPDARDPEVLSLMTVIINRVKGQMTNEVPRIFEAVFECTLLMITTNFEDFPEHRVNFFELLRAINNHCFHAFFMMSHDFKLVIDSIVWAFKHTMRNIAESGLYILIELWKNVAQSPEIAGVFYKTYYLNLLQDLFCVLTDTFHKSGTYYHFFTAFLFVFLSCFFFLSCPTM